MYCECAESGGGGGSRFFGQQMNKSAVESSNQKSGFAVNSARKIKNRQENQCQSNYHLFQILNTANVRKHGLMVSFI